MIQKSTHSFIIDLIKGDYFGEIGFFSEMPRCLSCKSREYTELYCISNKDFLKIAADYISAIVIC